MARMALLIGCGRFEDTKLSNLVAPDADLAALTAVLAAPDVGGFDEPVVLQDTSERTIRREVARLCTDAGPNDLLLLYYSGHGIKDSHGKLYLAASDTESAYLGGTAIPASWVTDQFESCPARSQVMILDCCNSGAFARGTKGVVGERLGWGPTFGHGRGRVVLTATDSTQYAWEGDHVTGNASPSIFTQVLVEGLTTGRADRDGDGRITVDELFGFVYEGVRRIRPEQTPMKWAEGQHGELVIAAAAQSATVALPPAIEHALDSPLPDVRLTAVIELGRLAAGPHVALARAAQAQLREMLDDDSNVVRRAVATALDASAATHGETVPAVDPIVGVDDSGSPATPASIAPIVEAAAPPSDAASSSAADQLPPFATEETAGTEPLTSDDAGPEDSGPPPDDKADPVIGATRRTTRWRSRRARLLAVAALALVAVVAGIVVITGDDPDDRGGGYEVAAIDARPNPEAEYSNTLADELAPIEEITARCLARAIVGTIGFDDIQATGLDPAALLASGDLGGTVVGELTQQSMQEEFMSCGDLVGTLASVETASETCLRRFVTGDLAAERLVVEYTGATPSAKLDATVDELDRCTTETAGTGSEGPEEPVPSEVVAPPGSDGESLDG